MANISVGGAALGAGVTGVIGTTEPALFGILLRVKRALIASGIAGACVIIFGILSNGLAMGGFGGLPIFFGPKFGISMIIAIGDMILPAALAYVIGFKDIPEDSKI